MSDNCRASIIINNYNYGRFLRQAIESALGQSYANTEVIVVDDGSVDDSREIMESYGERIVPVLQQNGGQTSAFNAGFRACQGDVICFLDADDTLLPGLTEKALELFREGNVSKVHWPLWETDVNGSRTGEIRPHDSLAEGDLREAVIRDGPEAYSSPPTGNAWARCFLERVFPLPETQGYKYGGADVYLSSLAPLFGLVKRISEPQGHYRLHGQNNYSRLSFEEKYKQDLWCYNDRCAALSRYCRELGVDVDAEDWKRRSWLHRFPITREDIRILVPPGNSFILVDQEDLGREVAPGRLALPFIERNGEYWGIPPDDDVAISEFERLRRSGASFMVFAWPAFWWLDYYTGLHEHLTSRFRCVLANERLVAFDLRAGSNEKNCAVS